ncbi:MAG TPA: hypothetical protein VMU15_03755 [Anaeromyxobacter sp.]|nr:hypothetical protein [Anaeromyxobacter sp.]
MAVKVMVAPAIARGGLADGPAGRSPAKASRARRRRSSVYDADGNEVFITLICLKCRKIRPLSQFGLRRMSDGSIRNQPWCRACRSAPSASADGGQTRPEEASATGESPVPGEPPGQAADRGAAPEHRRPGSVAAEIAAALAAGRR